MGITVQRSIPTNELSHTELAESLQQNLGLSKAVAGGVLSRMIARYGKLNPALGAWSFEERDVENGSGKSQILIKFGDRKGGKTPLTFVFKRVPQPITLRSQPGVTHYGHDRLALTNVIRGNEVTPLSTPAEVGTGVHAETLDTLDGTTPALVAGKIGEVTRETLGEGE